MFKLRKAISSELNSFAEMDGSERVAEFVIGNSLAEHQAAFHASELVYLSIIESGELVGYILLAKENNALRVEFRRIVIAQPGKGLGQQAISLMENYCAEKFGTKTIWLDVFEHNPRAVHIYSKLGYTKVGEAIHTKGRLIIMEKNLS